MRDESAFTPPQRGQSQFHQRIAAIASLAARQYGVVARRQLSAIGLSGKRIDCELRLGRLHRLHPGVYAVGHRLVSREGRWMAAVLAGREGAVLSHRSAAQLWGLQAYDPGRVEITTPRSTRSLRQIQRHCAELRSDEVTIRQRIPITTASRTILDLAAVVRLEALEHALREREVRRISLRPSFEELLARYPRRRGVARLKSCLRRLDHLPTQRTRSELETRLLAFLDAWGLPRPVTNALLELDHGLVEADCLWKEHRVIAELDGYEAHGTHAAFQGDRSRDRALQATGWRTIRVTWQQLDDEPDAIAADLSRLLRRNTNVRDNVRSDGHGDE